MTDTSERRTAGRATGRADRRQMARTAAAMFAGAVVVSAVEGAIPGGPAVPVLPGVAALAVVVPLALFGPRLPAWALASLGPIGAALIAYAVATTPPGQGEGVLLYIWPVLWVSYFFGRRGTVAIVVWVGIVQAAALIHSGGLFDIWFDVIISVAVVAVVVRALSERNDRLVERLAAEARIDKLTGVLNRRGFEERATIEVDRARRERHSVGVAAFDIDHFKRVNDEWGHEAGDRVLAALGAVLREQSRSLDVVARIGGEEFIALLPGVDAGATLAYAERIRSAFGSIVEVPNVTLSAGVVAGVAPGALEGLLQAADSALYAAKHAGRDRAVVHDQALASISPLKNSMSAF